MGAKDRKEWLKALKPEVLRVQKEIEDVASSMEGIMEVLEEVNADVTENTEILETHFPSKATDLEDKFQPIVYAVDDNPEWGDITEWMNDLCEAVNELSK